MTTTRTVQDVADDLASRLGRSVTVVDPEIRILCASAHYGDEDEARVRAILQRVALPEVYRHIHGHGVRAWTGPGHVGPAQDLHFRGRLVIPVRRAGALLALVMIIETPEGALGPEHVADAERAAGEIAVLLEGPVVRADEERARRRALLRDLVDPDDGVRGRAAARAREVLPGAGRRVDVLTVAVRTSEHGADPDRLGALIETAVENLAITERPRPDALAQGDTAMVVTVRSDASPPVEPEALAARVRVAVEGLVGPGASCVVGLPGSPVDVGGLRRARRESALAADAARRLPRLGPVTRWTSLGVLRTLLHLTREALEESVPDELRALLDDDPRGVLRRTLAVYLDEGGSAPNTARRLSLHRTSLYYRLDQIAQRTGTDLHDGVARLTLHLGLRALDLLGGDDDGIPTERGITG